MFKEVLIPICLAIEFSACYNKKNPKCYIPKAIWNAQQIFYLAAQMNAAFTTRFVSPNNHELIERLWTHFMQDNAFYSKEIEGQICLHQSSASDMTNFVKDSHRLECFSVDFTENLCGLELDIQEAFSATRFVALQAWLAAVQAMNTSGKCFHTLDAFICFLELILHPSACLAVGIVLETVSPLVVRGRVQQDSQEGHFCEVNRTCLWNRYIGQSWHTACSDQEK